MTHPVNIILTWIGFFYVPHSDSDDLATARTHQKLAIWKNLR